MSDKNKKNLHYFEDTSMKKLFSRLKKWQNKNKKRFLSTNIQKDGKFFCCIALANPTEVVIMGSSSRNNSDYFEARVGDNGSLEVFTTNM